MYDKIVGIAVEMPNGELIIKMGQAPPIPFGADAPKLEMLHL